MAKQAVVDKDNCIGCGACVAVAGKSFKIDGDGKSVALEPPGDDENTIQQALEGCPTKAINWKE